MKFFTFLFFVTSVSLAAGGLEKNAINATMQQNQSKLRACYEDALKNDPKLAGTVTLAFTITSEGGVTKASTKNSTLNNPGVENCITSALESITFPKSKSESVVSAYPLKLTPYQETVFTHKKKNPMVKEKQ